MKKIKKIFYWLTNFDKFKDMSTSDKFDYLFWGQIYLWVALWIIALFLCFPLKVNADATFIYYDANTSEIVSSSSVIQLTFNAPIDCRLIAIDTNQSGFLTYVAVSEDLTIINQYSKYWSSTTTRFVKEGNYAINSLTINITTSNIPVLPLGDFSTSTEAAIYYTFGAGATENSGYYKIAANYCFNFGVNNNQERSIQWNNEIRSVTFYTGSSYRTYFVRPYDSNLQYIFNSSSTSCGGDWSNSSIARVTYNGTQYSLFYSTYTGPPHFLFYRVDSFSSNDAIELTYGETANYLMSLPETIEYDRVRQIYPTELVREVANFVQATKGLYYSASAKKQTVSFYTTRYDKEIDAIYSYYLTFDQSRVKNTYSLTSNGFDMTFNEMTSTVWGTTAIYDKSLFSWYSPTEYLSNPDSLNKSNNWTVYAKIYPNPSDAFIYDAVFDNAYRGVYGPAAFDFPSTIHFIEQEREDFENPYFPGENVKFYVAVNETDKYYDYYVLLALNVGLNNSIKAIYNYPWYLENDDGTPHDVKDFYYAMSFLNLDNVWLRSLFLDDPENYVVGTDIDPSLTLEQKDPNALGVTLTESDDIKRGRFASWENFSSNLTEYLQTEHNDIQSTIDTWSQNYQVVHNAMRGFVNNRYTSSVQWVSNQVDYIYYNTDLKWFIDVSLIFALAMGVIL